MQLKVPEILMRKEQSLQLWMALFFPTRYNLRENGERYTFVYSCFLWRIYVFMLGCAFVATVFTILKILKHTYNTLFDQRTCGSGLFFWAINNSVQNKRTNYELFSQPLTFSMFTRRFHVFWHFWGKISHVFWCFSGKKFPIFWHFWEI